MPRKPVNSPRTSGRSANRASTRKPPMQRAATAVDSPPNSTFQGTALFPTPEHLSAVWSQWAEQMQRAGERTWKGFLQDAEVEGEAARHASTPQQWAGLPVGFVAEQAARWAQLSSQVSAGLLDMQATLFKDLEALATQLMAPWLTHNGRIAFGSAQDLVEPPAAAPAQLLWSAQKMWSESAKVWLQAMTHDLQAESPQAGARSAG
jgi:hypothetical protein